MPDNRTARRLEQITASYRALGCDNWNVWWDYQDKLTHCRVTWSDGDGSIVVHLTQKENNLTLMVLAGQEMQRRLAEERPNLTFPPVVWT